MTGKLKKKNKQKKKFRRDAFVTPTEFRSTTT